MSKVPGSFKEAEKKRTEELKAAGMEVSEKTDKTVSILEFNKVSSELEKAKAKAEENWERLLRKEAELRNAETRANTAIERERKYALEKLFKEILGVLDGFDGGIDSIDKAEDVSEAKEGMQMIHNLFLDSLAKFGLEVIQAKGEKFDPSLHEAMTMIPSEELEPNSIADVVQKGYVLNGRVIRSAKVIVVKENS